MSDDIDWSKAGLGATSSVYKIGEAIHRYLGSEEFAKVGATVRKITQVAVDFSLSKEVMAIGKAVHSLQFTVAKSLADPDSHLSRNIGSVLQFASALHRTSIEQGSELSRLIDSSEKFSATYKTGSPRSLYKLVNDNSDMVDLIRSGRVNLDEALACFQEVAAKVPDTGGLSKAFDNDDLNSDARSEAMNALLSAGSLKGVSSPGLKYVIATAILLTFIFTLINQSFEVQKNFSGLFAKVDTSAEARSKARHIPDGVSREQLSGCRVLTGDRVHLRDGPGKRHPSIEVLPMGALLQVLDTSGKAWILVSVVVDEELLEGWVLRRYTKRIR